MSLAAIEGILEDIAFFQGFKQEEIAMLTDVGKWSKVAVGERIVTQGEEDLQMFVLVQGKAEVIYNNKVVGTINSGEIFGEIGLMGQARIAHVNSCQECLLITFNANDLNNLPIVLQAKFLRQVLYSVFMRLQKINAQKWLSTRNKTKSEKKEA